MQSLRKLSLSRSSPALVRSVPALSRGLETFIGCGSSTGQIALRNAEQKSAAFSSSITETAPRVLSLQRDFLRSVPWIKRAYNVTLPEPVCADALEPRAAPEVSLPAEDEMRALLTQAFREKVNAAEIHTINRLIIQGRMELEETLMLWKGPSHVANWFDAAQATKATTEAPADFLDNFFTGKL